MSIKINSLEIENIKRIKAVALTPSKNGLTVIGGKNGQGKTSVLDSIAWGLGGDKFRPTVAQREGSVIPPNLHITLSNGLVVERKGKNSDLKVTDLNGNKSGQQLLNTFIDQLALNLPQFLQSTAKEKAQTLLKIIGIGDKLYELESQEQQLYNRRLAIGQIADQKKKYAKEMKEYLDAPKDIISASELIKQQQNMLALNGENQRKRDNKQVIEADINKLQGMVSDAKYRYEELEKQYNSKLQDYEIAKKSTENLVDESTAELEKNINDVESVNIKVRANLDKMKAEEEAKGYTAQYDTLTSEVEAVREQKTNLLKDADLPLKGLSVEDGELTYNGFKWDNMSGAEHLKVGTAIVRKLNPECGFVLLDKLEQMDIDSLKEFGEWLEKEGLQAIATRVSIGKECSVIISDGYVAGQECIIPTIENKEWKAGQF